MCQPPLIVRAQDAWAHLPQTPHEMRKPIDGSTQPSTLQGPALFASAKKRTSLLVHSLQSVLTLHNDFGHTHFFAFFSEKDACDEASMHEI